jgi:protein-disulfide isomerase
MKALTSIGALALALLLAGCGEGGQGNETAAAGKNEAPLAQIPAPNGDWTQGVSATPAGGFVMGNPNAPVKVIEFASMTCPHCAEFSETGAPQLVDKYVKSGQVSFEIRNFVRDPADLAASLLARCSGPAPFFKLTDQLFAAQNEWFARIQGMPQAQQQRLQSLPPQQVPGEIAQAAGLVDFVRVRGVPSEKARQCLGNEAELNRLVQMQQTAMTEYPGFPGTPTFIINGRLAENAGTWDRLEPQIRAAIG